MDVRLFRNAMAASVALVLTACSPVKNESTVFPKATPECEAQALARRFVARWNDGHVTLLTGQSRDDLLRTFVTKNLNSLERVEPDFIVKRPESQTVSLMSSTVDNWDVVRIHADSAWQRNARGGGITVAVVDTGLDINHTQIRNQIAYNKGEVPANGVDDDGNGFIDDYAGYDFSKSAPLIRDYDAHGTHVSGIIAAEHSDTVAGERSYVQGIAPEAKILPLAFIDDSGSGSLYSAMLAIDYAVSRGVQVINASWGGAGCSVILRDQIANLYQKGIAFVAAAGNSGMDIDRLPEYPAAYNLLSQFTIGATGTFNGRASFSNYGDRAVHVFAPGVDIVSTIPGNQLGSMSGTSMATPIVSGALAVLLSAKSGASLDELRNALYGSAVTDLTYHNASRGRIDLGAAVSLILR